MTVTARRGGILRLAAVTTIGCPALTPWAAAVGVGVGGASEAGSLGLDPQEILGARGYEGTHQLEKGPLAEHLSTVAVEPTGATVPLAAAATEQASHQVVGASKQKNSVVPTGSSPAGAAPASSSPSYGASSYGAGASYSAPASSSPSYGASSYGAGAYGGAAPGGAYGGGAAAYGAPSGGAMTITKTTQQCIIPMWAQNEYVCSEHSLVPKSSRWKDANGLNRKKVDERDTCTVQCPMQKRWMAPSVLTMICEDGEWSDVSTKEVVMSIQCGTANWVYYLLLASIIGAVYYYQNYYHVAAASPSAQAAPEAAAPAAPAQ